MVGYAQHKRNIHLYRNGIVQHTYEGNNRKDDLVRFAKDPDSKPPKETDWADAENDVIHLTSENFNETLKVCTYLNYTTIIFPIFKSNIIYLKIGKTIVI